MRKIRLFVEEKKLYQGLETKILGGDFEYLTKVMRQKIGDKIFLFNGVDGEFFGTISAVEKKSLTIAIKEKIFDLKKVPNITLAFALVKNVRIDFIAEKATELGVNCFQPVITKHTIVDKMNIERFHANIKEACEQCERNDFPQVCEIKKLEKFLVEPDFSKKILLLCDESGGGKKASEVFPKIKKSSSDSDSEIVIFIGPEGGFSKEEFGKFKSLPNLYSLGLGPRILRADTAIISALTLVQEFFGDFDQKPNFRN